MRLAYLLRGLNSPRSYTDPYWEGTTVQQSRSYPNLWRQRCSGQYAIVAVFGGRTNGVGGHRRAATYSPTRADGTCPSAGIGSVIAKPITLRGNDETLADFDAARVDHWSERGHRALLRINGLDALRFERFQFVRGTGRRDMTVLDLGTARLSLC